MVTEKKGKGVFSFFSIDGDATYDILLSLFQKTKETSLQKAIEKALETEDINDNVYQSACFLKVVLPYNEHINDTYKRVIIR